MTTAPHSRATITCAWSTMYWSSTTPVTTPETGVILNFGKFDCGATVFSFGNSLDSDILGIPY